MSIEGYSEEDLALLTDAERAALEEDDEDGEGEGDEDGNEHGDGNDGDAGDDAGTGDGVDNDEGDADDQSGDDDKAKPDGNDADGGDEGADPTKTKTDAEDEGDEKVDPKPKPLFKADVPQDVEAQRTSLDTREDDLVAKFDNGDITFAEYNKELRVINRERSALDTAVLKAELAAEAQSTQAQQSWELTANQFVSEHPIIGKNATTWQTFDTVLRAITTETISKGGQPGRRELEKAYKQWTSDLGIADTTAKPAEQAKEEPAKQAKPKKANAVPPNLGKIPAAADVDVDNGRFAHLDRLAESDPVAYEAAFAKLSAADQEEYLAS